MPLDDERLLGAKDQSRRDFLNDVLLGVGGAGIIGVLALKDSLSKDNPEWVVDYQEGTVVDKHIGVEKLFGFTRDTNYFLQVLGPEAIFWYHVSPTSYFDLDRGNKVEMGVKLLKLPVRDEHRNIVKYERVAGHAPEQFGDIRYTPKVSVK